MLAAISKAIATASVNISTADVKTTGSEGRSLMVFDLIVTSAQQLNNLMHSVAAIEGVLKVSRLSHQNGASADRRL
jgi:(p)ppGpp synthase/HD superfamily hydrolase